MGYATAAPRLGVLGAQWDRLLKQLSQSFDWQHRVTFLGARYAGNDDWDVRFLSSRATNFVYVQLQTNSTGGRDYNASTYVSRTLYDMRANRHREVTVAATGRTFCFLIPAFQKRDGSYTLFDGVDADDHMAVFDFGERTGSDIQAIADGDASPSVTGADILRTANTVATTITGLDDATEGRRVTVIIGDANTTVDFTGSGLKGNAGVDWSPTLGDFMHCMYDGTDWLCSVHEC